MARRRTAGAERDDRLARWRPAVITALALVAGAAVFWGLFWHQIADSALTRAPLLDEAWYLEQAARWRADGFPGDDAFVMSPAYPLLVAATGGQAPSDGVLRDHPDALLGLQALGWLLCGLIVAAVVGGAGRRAGLDRRAALVAGAAAAALFWLYRPAAIYARTILLEVPLTVLAAGAVAAAGAVRPGPVGRALLVGLCLGLAAALRAHVLVLLLVLVPATCRAAAPRRRQLLAAGLLVVLAVAPVAMAAWHNTRVAGRLAGPSLNGGVNLYLGQLPSAGGLFTSLAGFDMERDPSGARYLAERLGRPVAGPAEADRIWMAEARTLVARAPGRALLRWLDKIRLHLQGWEIAQVTPLHAWPVEAPVLRLLPVPWGLLIVLAGVGATLVFSTRRDPGGATVARGHGLSRQALTWAAAAVLLVAVQSLFFVVSRYRLILAPPLAVLTGLGLVAALAARPMAPRRWLAPAVALLVAGLLVVPWGLGQAQRTWAGLEHLNLARRLMLVAGPGDRERADELLADACRVAGERSEVWQLRAQNQVALGRPDAALITLADGILEVADPEVLERLRIALLRAQGRLDEAEALSLVYLRDRPEDRDVLHDLAVLQGTRGRWTEAAATAERLRRIAPRDHRGWLDLAVALARLGREDEARQVLGRGLETVPDGPGRELLAENLRRLERRGGE